MNKTHKIQLLTKLAKIGVKAKEDDAGYEIEFPDGNRFLVFSVYGHDIGVSKRGDKT